MQQRDRKTAEKQRDKDMAEQYPEGLPYSERRRVRTTAEKQRDQQRQQAREFKRAHRYGDAIGTLVEASNMKRAEVLRALDERAAS